MWAAGIIMYEILTGKHPFMMANLPQEQFLPWLSKVKKFIYPPHVSEYARNLISYLCHPK